MTTSTYQNSELYDYTGTNIPWQTPVITELTSAQALAKHSIYDAYLACPWANIIDWMNHGSGDRKKLANTALNNIKKIKNKKITVCQHYKFRTIIPLLKYIKCEDVYTPHATESEIDGVRIHGFPLFAPVIPDCIEQRELLYSFVGAYMPHYISDIRLKIFNDIHPSNTVVVPRGKWQFNAEVYNEQVTDKETPAFESYKAAQNKQYYKNVLEQSRFSLCPSGAGPASIRIYESLACGAIPVILADTFRFPQVKGVDWSECVVNIKEGNYRDMRKILKSIPLAREKEMRHNCIRAYNNVSGDNIIKCITDKYE